VDWVHEFVPGNTRAACSICGCSRRFPDNLTYCVDKLFRCEKCMEITAMERDQQIAAYRARAEELDTGIGILPGAEVPTSFLADAAEYRAHVLPGWTPTSTFYEDFTVVPGGVGSSWTILASGGTASLPAAGVARLSCTAVGQYIQITANAVSIPAQTAGNAFCAFRAKTVPTSTTAYLTGGAVGAGQAVATGVIPGPALYGLFQSNRTANTDVAVESSGYHMFYVWWRTNGKAMGAVDDSPSVFTTSSVSATRTPFLLAQDIAYMDVTDYVAYT
jgi:hypothetical protein